MSLQVGTVPTVRDIFPMECPYVPIHVLTGRDRLSGLRLRLIWRGNRLLALYTQQYIRTIPGIPGHSKSRYLTEAVCRVVLVRKPQPRTNQVAVPGDLRWRHTLRAQWKWPQQHSQSVRVYHTNNLLGVL